MGRGTRRRQQRRTRTTGIAVAAFAGVTLAAGTAVAPASAAAPAGWLTAWAGAQQDPGPLAPIITAHDGIGGRTVRNVVRPSTSGRTIRVRLTNLFGSQATTFDDVRVALGAGGAAAVPGTTVRVTFAGRTSVRVPRGGSVLSDAVVRPVTAGRTLLVSLYSQGATGTTTNSGGLMHTNFLSDAGDATAQDSGAAFTTAVKNWYFLAGVDVRPARRSGGGVVAFGASSTAGTGSTPDAARSWPDGLAARLRQAAPALSRPVLNLGIPGNTLHASSPCYGQSALERMNRDVFGQTGVRYLVVSLGVNDIIQPRQPHTGLLGPCDAKTTISTAGMIALYRQLIQRAHAHGLRVLGATITPFGAYRAWTPEMEAQRVAVNRWIRTGHAFDAVVDFAKAVADPADPTRLNPRMDSGDGLHPNDIGYAANAAAIPLSFFTEGAS